MPQDMSEPLVTLTAADMDDPELLAELAAITGEAPPPARRATAPAPPDPSQLRAQAEAKKQEALRLKRAGDIPGASQALRQYKALQTQLAAPRPAATPAGTPAPTGGGGASAPLSTDDLAAVLEGRVTQSVGSITATDGDLDDPELLAELAAVIGGPPPPPTKRPPQQPQPPALPPKSQPQPQPQASRSPPAAPHTPVPARSGHAGGFAAGGATPPGCGSSSIGPSSASTVHQSSAPPPLPVPLIPALSAGPGADAQRAAAAVPAQRAEVQARLSEARADAARAKAGGLKVEAMRALREANRLQEVLRGMEAAGGKGGGPQPAQQETHPQQPSPPQPPPSSRGAQGQAEWGMGAQARRGGGGGAEGGPCVGMGAAESAMGHGASIPDAMPAGSLKPEAEDEAEDEMARLVAVMNAPVGSGRAMSGGAAISGAAAISGRTAVSGGGGARGASRDLEPGLLGAAVLHAAAGGGTDDTDEDELQRLLDSMDRGGGEEAALSPELAGLLALMAGGRPAPAEEEVHPELVRLVQHMNGGPGAAAGRRGGGAGEEQACEELEDLVRRMSGVSPTQAAAKSRQGGKPGGAGQGGIPGVGGPAAGRQGGEKGGKALNAASGAAGYSGSPVPARDADGAVSAAARRRAAEERFLASDEGQMLLAAGVPAHEIVASLPAETERRVEYADGTPSVALLPPVHGAPLAAAVPASTALAPCSGSALSLGSAPSSGSALSLDHAAAASVRALRAEAFRLKQAGDVQGAMAKLRQAKGLAAAGLVAGRASDEGGAGAARPGVGERGEETSFEDPKALPGPSPTVPPAPAPPAPAAAAPPPAVSVSGLTVAPPLAVSATGLAAHVACLKREAVALKRSGDVAGAMAKLRQVRGAEAAGAVPPAVAAAEAAQATVMARAAAAAATAAVAMVESREDAGDEAAGAVGAEPGGSTGEEPAGMEAGAEGEGGTAVLAQGAVEGAGAATEAVAAATADVPLSAAPEAPTARGGAAQLAILPLELQATVPACIEWLKRQAVAHKQAGRMQEAVAALRELKQLQAQLPALAPTCATGGGASSATPPPPVALPAAARPEPHENLDLTKLELEVTFLSASLAVGSAGAPAASYARLRWELMPGVGTAALDASTPHASPGLSPEWRHKATAVFVADPRRSRSIARHVSTGRAAVEVWAVPRGLGRLLFGAREVLMGIGELRMAPLMEQATVLANVPLRDPTAGGGGAAGAGVAPGGVGAAGGGGEASAGGAVAGVIGHVTVQLRVRTPIGAAPPSPGGTAAPPPASPPAAPPPLTPRAAAAVAAVAAEEEDDLGFVNSIVSYDVLERLAGEIAARRAALEAKGSVVPLSFEARQQTLEFRREMIQIQVGGGGR